MNFEKKTALSDGWLPADGATFIITVNIYQSITTSEEFTHLWNKTGNVRARLSDGRRMRFGGMQPTSRRNAHLQSRGRTISRFYGSKRNGHCRAPKRPLCIPPKNGCSHSSSIFHIHTQQTRTITWSPVNDAPLSSENGSPKDVLPSTQHGSARPTQPKFISKLRFNKNSNVIRSCCSDDRSHRRNR